MDKESLAERCKAGDRDAMGALYRTYLRPMREVVSYYVHNNDVVRDILHDGFIIAFGSMDSLKKPDKLEAWLTSIMKNLALQYVREETNRMVVPLSETGAENECDENTPEQELSWDELDKIIGKLPEGYGNVFRLAVLDGLSHKEIGALLGIAPHSSSSQLSHAKAMLRRMIAEYRNEIGFLSFIGILLLLWHGLFRIDEENQTMPAMSKSNGNSTMVVTDSVASENDEIESVERQRPVVYKAMRPKETEAVAVVTTTPDSVETAVADSTAKDSIIAMPLMTGSGELIAVNDLPEIRTEGASAWSLAIAYSGTPGHDEYDRYRIPNPELPDVEGPDAEIEEKVKTRHYMPVVIGLSVNRSLSTRWSVEAGLRYTYLRSDVLKENKFSQMETMQRIHYIGVPIKFNYRIATYNGFSLYGHGGGALDIPVYGRQTMREYSPTWGNTERSAVRIDAPMQWSAEGGIGLQYHISPTFSIYAEPSFRYYFNPGTDIRTIRQEKPFEFTIPIGLRLTW